MSSPNSGKSSHGSRITNIRFTSCPLKSFCLYIRNFSVFFTLPEKNFFEKVLCLTQRYRLEERGFSQFGQKNKTDLSKLTDRFLLSPAGARVVTSCPKGILYSVELLSPAGARAVTLNPAAACRRDRLAVPRRGASCYFGIPSQREAHAHNVAVPRRGASCYSKNAKNTMRIFGIPTIFLYYLLYFCVSIRDIVGFLWCEPTRNNLIYCYYSTRFAPNQPVPKPSSIATGCKTQCHKL